MTEEEYYKRKLEIEREYYNQKLHKEFDKKAPKLLEENKHWKEFEHSAGVAAAAGTMALTAIREREGLEATVATITTICATVRATTALAVVSGAKSFNLVSSLFQ